MVEQYLLGREKELVEVFEKELAEVPIPLPATVSNFFIRPPLTIKEVDEKREEEIGSSESLDVLENEVLDFLQNGSMVEEEEEDPASLLSSLFADLLRE